MTASIPPGWVLLLGALLVPLLRGRARAAFLLLLPAISLIHLCMLPHGELLQLGVFEYNLVPIRVDRLSLLFGYIFHIAAFIGALYALRLTDTAQHVAAFMYAGAAIGAVFAGDLITLFVYWELAAVTSVFLIWARRSERSYRAGMRYVVIQLGSGVLLLAGTILRAHESGSIAFDYLGLGGRGTLLILLAFGIKCAFPLLHNWLQDAYPEATVTGTVFLSAFTTKLAVYALVRGYPGTESLIWVGAVMTAFPIFYAVIENDLRRVLTYSMNNQLGFMVIGVGLGTEMAINGATAHAFADILFKGLLLMSIGAVLHRTGTAKASDLGGLYKSMPWSATFCVIGSMSISAFPLFSAFVTKSLIIAAAAEQHQTVAYFIMLFASVGVLEHAGIKIPFFAFFAHDSGIRCKEAPRNMLLAMAIAATLCIGIGVFPAGFLHFASARRQLPTLHADPRGDATTAVALGDRRLRFLELVRLLPRRGASHQPGCRLDLSSCPTGVRQPTLVDRSAGSSGPAGGYPGASRAHHRHDPSLSWAERRPRANLAYR